MIFFTIQNLILSIHGSLSIMNTQRFFSILIFTVFIILSALSVEASDTSSAVSFEQAWQQLQKRSDVLAAQQSAIDQQASLQQAAAALNFPDIRLGAAYARLSEPIEVNAADLAPLSSLSPAKLRQSLGGLVQSGLIPPEIAAGMGTLLQDLAGSGLLDTTTEISDENIFTSSINVIWPIFTGFRIQALQDIAQQQTQAAKAEFSLLCRAQFEILAKLYFGVVLSKQVLATHREAEKGLRLHYKHALALEKQGQIARVERLKAEAALDRTKVETEKSRRSLEIAELALNRMLQQNDIVPVTPLFITRQLPKMEHFLVQTLDNHPGLALLTAKAKQADSLITAEKGNYYPKVFLFGSYNFYKEDSIIGRSAPDWVAGAGVGMALFDSTGRGDKLQAAHSVLARVNHLYNEAKRELSVLVEKSWKEAVQAATEFRGLQSSISLAQENVRLQEKAFSQGVSTSLDVVDAHLFLEEVKTMQAAASYRYVICLARLLAVSGEMEHFDRYRN